MDPVLLGKLTLLMINSACPRGAGWHGSLYYLFPPETIPIGAAEAERRLRSPADPMVFEIAFRGDTVIVLRRHPSDVELDMMVATGEAVREAILEEDRQATKADVSDAEGRASILGSVAEIFRFLTLRMSHDVPVSVVRRARGPGVVLGRRQR